MVTGGLDEVKTENKEKKTEVKRKRFVVWNVNNESYKLKLNVGEITRLEEKYGGNLATIILSDDLPPLSIMLTVIQAAMVPYNHGISYMDVQKLFDQYVEEGGYQAGLYKDVIIPLLNVSGFFSPKMSEELMEYAQSLDI